MPELAEFRFESGLEYLTIYFMGRLRINIFVEIDEVDTATKNISISLKHFHLCHSNANFSIESISTLESDFSRSLDARLAVRQKSPPKSKKTSGFDFFFLLTAAR